MKNGYDAKNVKTDGKPGHVGFQRLRITARYPGSVCMQGPEMKGAVPTGAGQIACGQEHDASRAQVIQSKAVAILDLSECWRIGHMVRIWRDYAGKLAMGR